MESSPKKEIAFSAHPYCGEDFTISGICCAKLPDNNEYYIFVSASGLTFVTCSPALAPEVELVKNLVYKQNCYVKARLHKEGGEYHLRMFATSNKTNGKEANDDGK